MLHAKQIKNTQKQKKSLFKCYDKYQPALLSKGIKEASPVRPTNPALFD